MPAPSAGRDPPLLTSGDFDPTRHTSGAKPQRIHGAVPISGEFYEPERRAWARRFASSKIDWATSASFLWSFWLISRNFTNASALVHPLRLTTMPMA